MAKYPNQNTIKICSSSGTHSVITKSYGIITQTELQTAYRVLDDRRNGTPIMLFTALAVNQDGYQLDFSPAELEHRFGVAADRWRKAFIQRLLWQCLQSMRLLA